MRHTAHLALMALISVTIGNALKIEVNQTTLFDKGPIKMKSGHNRDIKTQSEVNQRAFNLGSASQKGAQSRATRTLPEAGAFFQVHNKANQGASKMGHALQEGVQSHSAQTLPEVDAPVQAQNPAHQGTFKMGRASPQKGHLVTGTLAKTYELSPARQKADALPDKLAREVKEDFSLGRHKITGMIKDGCKSRLESCWWKALVQRSLVSSDPRLREFLCVKFFEGNNHKMFNFSALSIDLSISMHAFCVAPRNGQIAKMNT